MKSKHLFLLVAILFLALTISILEFKKEAKNGVVVAENSNKKHLAAIKEIHNLLFFNYIYSLKTEDLVAGAVAGIDGFLKKKKILIDLDYSNVKEISQLQTLFSNVINQSAGKIVPDELFKAMIDGMIKKLGDPHTTYLSPRDYKKLTEIMQGGNFSGVGIFIELDKENNNKLMVVKPIEGAPAFKAGLMAGDYIIMIDDLLTEGIDIQRAQDLIRGRLGTKVTLTIERKLPGSKRFEAHKFTLIRENIHVKSVATKMLNGDIGYIELGNFGEYTSKELEEGILTLEKSGARKFILDLRNNGGGYITAAIDVTSKFIPRGRTVVSVVDRNNRTRSYSSKGNLPRNHTRSYPSKGGQYLDLPLVVLVNRFSASASEITAGALQDYGRAKLIGERTFGKASVQTIHPLEEEYGGGALKLTTAKYLTPNGRDITKIGIIPDIVVAIKNHPKKDKEDPQLEKAIEALKS